MSVRIIPYFFGVKTLPWTFGTPNIECEVKYKKAPNKLLAPPPKIRMRTEDRLLVSQVRVVADRKFMWKAKELAI